MREFQLHTPARPGQPSIIKADRFRIVDGAAVFYRGQEAFLAVAPGNWTGIREQEEDITA